LPEVRLQQVQLPRSHRRTVLFVHGAGGGGWEWNIWARVFATQDIVVAAPDLLPVASGLSQTRLADYSTQVRGAALAMPMPRVFVGASLGGLLALMNADIADAMVLVNPLPPAPWCSRLPVRESYPGVIPWRSDASLEGTRRSLSDADDEACLYAFRHWRDESGAVMNEALAGVSVPMPKCRVLLMASGRDDDVPDAVSLAMARDMAADTIRLPDASHVGPLLGRNAAEAASQAVAWLNGLPKPI
jgi:pimeloyl-ACP methyl ester carboxylesterase